MTEWISVKDKLPEKEGKYLTYDKWGYILIKHYRSKGKRFSNLITNRYLVTHWMPLPETPT